MIDPQDLRITSYLPQTGHGAGGMTVGLNPSGIIVHHVPTGLGVSCDSERSQYANKEKALQLLESLLLAIESEKLLDAQQAEFQRIASIPNKVPDRVQMIKTVRERVGCGLKEAKDAVDKMGTVEGAMLHLTGSTGYCEQGSQCCCGGDLPAIRECCFYWKKL